MYYLHIDCNSYFASCEIATRPELEGKPVVVANDNENGGGVILALNTEAKALGLTRGIPLFKVRQKLESEHVEICTADHKKYRRISHAIMDEVIQQGIVQDFIQYSVDEFFGTMPLDDPDELRFYVSKVRDLIWQSNHIPVGCGLSQTYTLAKVATHFAKRHRGYDGICILPPDKRERALSLLTVGEVWGIGRQNRRHLESAGFRTALDFAKAPESQILKLLNTAGVHTWQELNGTPAITLTSHERQKSIMQSHTFAVMIKEKEQLAIEMATFTSRCAVTLRHQGSLCSAVTVFVSTNRYRDDLSQYRNQASCRLEKPTADTPVLLKTVASLLDSIFRPGYLYKQAGVVLSGIIPDEGHQLDLFTEPDDERRRRLMSVTDSINLKYGPESITFGKA